jgi:hypothetical protein
MTDIAKGIMQDAVVQIPGLSVQIEHFVDRVITVPHPALAE